MSLVQQDFFNGNTLKTKTSSNKTQRTNKKPQNTTLTELRESIIISLSSDNIFTPTEKYLVFLLQRWNDIMQSCQSKKIIPHHNM